jgi:hypothetical protein
MLPWKFILQFCTIVESYNLVISYKVIHCMFLTYNHAGGGVRKRKLGYDTHSSQTNSIEYILRDISTCSQVLCILTTWIHNNMGTTEKDKITNCNICNHAGGGVRKRKLGYDTHSSQKYMFT